MRSGRPSRRGEGHHRHFQVVRSLGEARQLADHCRMENISDLARSGLKTRSARREQLEEDVKAWYEKRIEASPKCELAIQHAGGHASNSTSAPQAPS